MNPESEPFMVSEKAAIQSSAKFEYYFAGLIFAVLGLSVQTVHWRSSIWPDGAELLAWLCYAISGLASLFVLERHVIYAWLQTNYDLQQALNKELESLQHADPKYLARLKEVSTQANRFFGLMHTTNKMVSLVWRLRRAFFISGTIALLAARSSPGLRVFFDLFFVRT